MVTVSFPGINIGNFEIDPVAFEIPIFNGIQVRWYGLIITLGIILAFIYCAFRAKQEGVDFDNLLDIALFTIVFAVIGARAYYVLTSLDKYDSFYDVIAIWEGGLAIYGAVIAGAITIFCVCKFKKISPIKMLDATAPAVMIGQIVGRWGNFCNGEAHGGIVSESSPLYFIRMGLYPHDVDGVRGMAFVHPTFLYESLWNLVGFLIINALYKKKKFDGQILLMYLTWYGFGRMLIEGLRTDSLYIGVFRISQVVGFVCFTVGAVLLIVNLIKARRARLTAEDYAPTYAKISHYGKSESDAVVHESTDNTEGIESQPSNTEPEAEPESKEDIENKFRDLFDQDK